MPNTLSVRMEIAMVAPQLAYALLHNVTNIFAYAPKL